MNKETKTTYNLIHQLKKIILFGFILYPIQINFEIIENKTLPFGKEEFFYNIDLKKRSTTQNFQYVGGGSFVVFPQVKNKFIIKEKNKELLLYLNVPEISTEGIKLDYDVSIKYPLQTNVQQLANQVKLFWNKNQLFDESVTGQGKTSTRPLWVIVSAEKIDQKEFFGNSAGPGITFENKEGFPFITSVYQSGPAEQAGIKTGDKILEIDGNMIRDLSSEKIREMFAGIAGSRVKLKIEREKQIKEIEIERKIWKIETIESSQ